MSDVTLPAGMTWRPLSLEDAEAMSVLQQACFAVDGGHRLTVGEMRDEFAAYGDLAETDSIGGFDAANRLVAAGWCQIPESVETEQRAFVWLFVHPVRRGVGVEDTLVEWIEWRARESVGDTGAGLPAALYRYEVYETMAADLALMNRHGYVAARFFTEDARDLAEPIEEALLDGRLTARRWSAEISEDARLVHNTSFADHWGAQPSTKEMWLLFEREFFLPEASWVVYDGDEPVAYLKSSRYPHDFDDRGRTEAWIEGVGTVPSHRGRGIATALVTMAMRAFGEDGMEYACLGVDSESPTGANRLYERLSFVPEQRWTAFRKTLAG